MSDNATVLGDFADWVDRLCDVVDSTHEKVRPLVERSDTWVDDALYLWGRANNWFLSSQIRGAVDIGRVGNGVRAGGWGYGQDALRIVGLIPVGRAGVGIVRGVTGLIRVVPTLRQLNAARNAIIILDQGRRPTCRFVATLNAANLSAGAYYFARLSKLLRVLPRRARRVARTRQEADAQYDELFNALERRGFDVDVVDGINRLEDIETLVRRFALDTTTFTISYTRVRRGAQVVQTAGAHRLAATYSRSLGLLIHDSAGGETMRGMAGLLHKYPGAQLRQSPIWRFKQSIVVIAEEDEAIATAWQSGRAISGVANEAAEVMIGGGVLGLGPLTIAFLVQPVVRQLTTVVPGLNGPPFVQSAR